MNKMWGEGDISTPCRWWLCFAFSREAGTLGSYFLLELSWAFRKTFLALLTFQVWPEAGKEMAHWLNLGKFKRQFQKASRMPFSFFFFSLHPAIPGFLQPPLCVCTCGRDMLRWRASKLWPKGNMQSPRGWGREWVRALSKLIWFIEMKTCGISYIWMSGSRTHISYTDSLKLPVFSRRNLVV